MNPNVEFVLDALGTVVGMQPTDHPLRRVDRDNSEVYEGDATVDMTQPLRERTEELKRSNFVGVASQNRSNTAIGQEYNLATDAVLSVRVEGLHHSEWGHIDPRGTEGVVFDDLYDVIRQALLNDGTYPTHPEFRDTKLDLRVQNEDYQSSDWADFYRREFDLVFNAREKLP